MAEARREEILSALRGQTVRIPDLTALYAHWPHHVNPEQQSVTSVVEYVLETHSMTDAVTMKLKKANLPLLISSWFPFASAQTLKDITYFVCWMYMVDDAVIDNLSWPGLDNEAAFKAAYQELMDFVAKSLKLDGDMSKPQPHSTVPAIDCFRGIGEVLCKKYTLHQRSKFYDTCKFTMDGYRTEQQLRVQGKIPTWEEYSEYRAGTSCMAMNVALIELSIETHIPSDILDSPEMQRLWMQTTSANYLANDIVSAKKELGEGFVENAVALHAIETLNAQDGLNKSVELVKEAIADFDRVAKIVEDKFCSPNSQSKRERNDQTRQFWKCPFKVKGWWSNLFKRFKKVSSLFFVIGTGQHNTDVRGIKTNGATNGPTDQMTNGHHEPSNKGEKASGPLAERPVAEQVREFVKCCRCIATGSLHWRSEHSHCSRPSYRHSLLT